MVAAFGDCALPLVAACFAGRGAASKASVGAKFKKSLDALTATLGATEPHYVRCVKSNPRKAPGTMDYKLCLEQLTYAGVLEAVKIHQRGFPFRLDHVAFRRSCGKLRSAFAQWCRSEPTTSSEKTCPRRDPGSPPQPQPSASAPCSTPARGGGGLRTPQKKNQNPRPKSPGASS